MNGVHFRGIYKTYAKFNKENQKMSTVTDWIGNTRKLTNYAQKSPWTLL